MNNKDDITSDGFLGSRLTICQPRQGYRAGTDAVMLAAAVPARPGDHVIEAGLGVGTASLCLLSRQPGISVTGIEQEPLAARLARRNGQANGFGDALQVIEADVSMPAKQWQAHGLRQAGYAHAYANPPFHEQGQARAPHDARRAAAHMRAEGMLERWIKFMLAMLRPRGSLTLILPAAALPELFELMQARAGRMSVLPLHPYATRPANRIIVQAIKGSRAPLRLLPGLVLHDADGKPSAMADAILRHGAPLDMALAQ